MRCGRLFRLLFKCHDGGIVAAAAFGGIIGREFGPDFLRHLQPMRFELGRCVELARQAALNLVDGLHMPPDAGHECGRHMATGATRLNTENIGLVRGTLEFLERFFHLVA